MRALLVSFLLVGCHRDLSVPPCAHDRSLCADAAVDALADSPSSDAGVEAADTCECAPGEVVAAAGACPGVFEKKTKVCAASCAWGAETCALPQGWTAIADAPIEGRVQNSAVWTGGELIVFGGGTSVDSGETLKDGAIYSLLKNEWTLLPETSLATAARQRHLAVWTGTQMIVWGGSASGTLRGDGLRYDASGKRWDEIAPSALSAREHASGTWIPSLNKLFIWGGNGQTGALNDGALYEPSTQTWTALPTAPIAPRMGAVSSWTGNEVLVWGGIANATTAFADGALYDPATNKWRAIPAAPISGRMQAGHGLVPSGFGVFAGWEAPLDGALLTLSPGLDWRLLPAPPTALAPRKYTQTWITEERVVVWSGVYNTESSPTFDSTGAVLDLKGGSWSLLPMTNAPAPRGAATTVAVGGGVLVWSGYVKPGGIIELATSGAIYVP